MFNKNMRKIYYIFLIIFLIFFFSLFFVSFQQEDYVTDSLGRKVKIADYKRIGIINPAALKSFIFLNIENSKIVAVDSYSIYKYKDFLSKDTINLGDFNNPNIETIVKSRIDLLILDQSFPIQKLYEIEKLNIPYFVYSTTPSNYSSISVNLQNLAKIINKTKEFEKLKSEMIDPYADKILKFKDKFSGKSILFVVWADKNITCAGDDSYLSYFAEYFGFVNCIKEKGWINISFERLLLLNPNYIIVASSFIDKQFFSNTLFKNINAVANNNIYYFNEKDEDVILQPSFDLWIGFYEILKRFY
ncbi:MAG: ABC transporter substrate-binding protein [Spirochaetales bacterium]|nr:ABC transporter substrate-binding protein [Spirochaetales bacterium]